METTQTANTEAALKAKAERQEQVMVLWRTGRYDTAQIALRLKIEEHEADHLLHCGLGIPGEPMRKKPSRTLWGFFPRRLSV